MARREAWAHFSMQADNYNYFQSQHDIECGLEHQVLMVMHLRNFALVNQNHAGLVVSRARTVYQVRLLG